MKKTPIKDILNFTYNEGDIRTGEAGATLKSLRVALRLNLIVSDQIDSKGVATRFKLTSLGYELATKLWKVAY
jgi:hypothetical protein